MNALNNLWTKLKGTPQTAAVPLEQAGAGASFNNPSIWTTLKNSAPMQFAAQHPYQTAGLGILGSANVAGLFDNDKFGGQLGGAALGGLGSAALHSLRGVTGLPLAWAPLIGGAVGALFDKSREVKEKQAASNQFQNLYG